MESPERALPVATLAAGAALMLALALLMIPFGGALGGPPAALERDGEDSSPAPSAFALEYIPPLYLRLYRAAAQRYGLDWTVLAGIGRVECDHGRDPSPSCTVEGAVNGAGAGGPMQFLASTWALYGVAPDGGRPDRWSPQDAIYSAANYLRESGAPGDYEQALLAYNHAGWYVAEVEHWATLYRGQPQPASPLVGPRRSWATSTPVVYVPGERARLEPGDGHVAMIPEAAPAVVQAMVIAGNELQSLPYGPEGHPDPLGAPSEDCSSTVNYVLYRSGVRPLAEIVADNPLAQDYVDWGLPGPGRWVTIYATDLPTPHVFMVIAGLRLDTSYAGTDIGPNREQSGPRWRILDHIPTWAHWSVRHAPGL